MESMLVNVKLNIQSASFNLSLIQGAFIGVWYMSRILSHATGHPDEWVMVPTLKELGICHLQIMCLLHQMIKPYSFWAAQGELRMHSMMEAKQTNNQTKYYDTVQYPVSRKTEIGSVAFSKKV